MIKIRKVIAKDLTDIKNVLDSSELFPSDYLDDMIADYFTNPNTEDIWFVAIDEKGISIGFGYCIPEKLTEGTYNLLAIAVNKELQSKGIGHQMMLFIEQLLKDQKGRILIVETSSDNHYASTRNFYLKQNYQVVATIKDFWKDGEDKVIFWKKLN